MRRLSWQCLDEFNRLWMQGRAWLRLWPSGRGYPSDATVRFEWTFFKGWRLALELTLVAQDSDDLSLHVALGFCSLWLTLQGFIPWKWRPAEHYLWGIQTGLSMSGEFLQLRLWHGDANGSGKDLGWRKSFFLLDALLGRAVYRQGSPDTTTTLIPMPERSYPVRITMRDDSWKRPRWFRRYIRRADVQFVEEGGNIPFPGKGENSWDCGIDGLYGMTCPARDVAEAVGKVVESVYRSRPRHWKPEPA